MLFNNKLANKIRSIISCGIDKDPWKRYSQKNKWFYNVKFLGFKFNFTDIQAALGLAQLKKLKNIISHRKKIRKIYDHSLSTLFKNKILFKYQVKKNIYSSEYIYTIFLNTKTKLSMRDKLVNYLEKNNIFTTVHYIPANYHEFYKKKFKKYKVSNSDFFFKNVISLPFHNKLSKKMLSKYRYN